MQDKMCEKKEIILQDTTKALNDWYEYQGAVACSCGREKISYVCENERPCNGQKFYCLKCMEEFKIHLHGGKKIIEVILSFDKPWINLKEKYEGLVHLVHISFKK